MRSMFADQPYSEVVNTQGESANLELTMTFSVLSPKLYAFGHLLFVECVDPLVVRFQLA